jgi:hypothetical protein
MIQFWGANGESGIDDLTIANNLFLQTEGGWTQSFFGGMSGGDPEVVSFTNFKIHDNVIVNSHFHGITVGSVTDSEIHHNLVLPAQGWADSGSANPIPRIALPDGAPSRSAQSRAQQYLGRP